MPSALRRPRPKLVSTTKAPFPSSRQARCIGLKPNTYPGYVRWAVDFDYADKLSDADRAWLSAFSEEHYKGWALARETQIHPPEQLREANAAHQRRRRGDDVLSFAEHRDPMSLSGLKSTEGPGSGRGHHHNDEQLRALAGASGRDTHELRGRNVVEDAMVSYLDRPKRVK